MITPLSELTTSARLGVLDRMLPRHVVSLPMTDERRPCDWVSGAAMVVRRSVFERIGLLDEGYFLYFDEVDFCFRARRAGFDVWYVPESRILHLEGVATGVNVARKRRGRWWYDSRRRFFVKGYGLIGLMAADFLWLIGRTSLMARRLLRLGGSTACDPTWFTFDILWGDLCAVLTGRVWSIRRPTAQSR